MSRIKKGKKEQKRDEKTMYPKNYTRERAQVKNSLKDAEQTRQIGSPSCFGLKDIPY